MLSETEIEIFGYRFNNIQLLEEALTHPSYKNSSPHEKPKNNAALESFGDMVLKVLQTRDICKQKPNSDKATITKCRQSIETNSILYQHIINMGLYEKVNIADEVKTDSLRYKKAYSKVLEAVIGAIYIDCNYDWDVLERWYYEKISSKV